MQIMSVLFVVFFILAVTCDISGTPDIDFDRLRSVPVKRQPYTSGRYQRHSIEHRGHTNAYDSDSSWERARTTPPSRRHIADVESNGVHEKVYAPKEEPREYYQSASYLRYALARNDVVALRELSSVFPELEPRLARMKMKAPQLRNRDRSSRYRELNSVSDYDDDLCIKCPAERTLVMRPGVAKVLLQVPRLKTCSGEKPPRGARLVRSCGPAFGSLVGAGSHVIFGRVAYKGRYIQSCRFQVHVVGHMCPVPRHLTAQCDGVRCNFTCADPTLELLGNTSLTCGDDLRWSGEPAVCRARTWCHLPQPPDNGQLSCQSAPSGTGTGVAEGARCRARCD